jgi:DNA-binding helix-turn-helix protein
MNVKEKITALRKEREWSKRRLAKEAGLTPSTIYNWYNERNNEPSKEAIEDICAAFNISMAEFFSDLEIDKLTEKETKLLEIFQKLPDKKKDALITVAKVLGE